MDTTDGGGDAPHNEPHTVALDCDDGPLEGMIINLAPGEGHYSYREGDSVHCYLVRPVGSFGQDVLCYCGECSLGAGLLEGGRDE